MNARVATATRLGFREQARRPLLLVLLVVLPFFFITRAIAATEPVQRRIALPGGEVLTTMRDIHGAMMVAITVAFLAGLCGAFIMRSAQSADRRLVVGGFRPIEALLPRVAVLAAATAVALTVSLAVTRAQLRAGVMAGVRARQPAHRSELRLHRRARRRRARAARRDLRRAVHRDARHGHPPEPGVRRRNPERPRLLLPD